MAELGLLSAPFMGQLHSNSLDPTVHRPDPARDKGRSTGGGRFHTLLEFVIRRPSHVAVFPNQEAVNLATFVTRRAEAANMAR